MYADVLDPVALIKIDHDWPHVTLRFSSISKDENSYLDIDIVILCYSYRRILDNEQFKQ
jgi:hypothetical protein